MPSALAPGLLAQANGGVVFLDEITALPLALQPKLLARTARAARAAARPERGELRSTCV